MKTLLCLSVLAAVAVSALAQLGMPLLSGFGTGATDPAGPGTASFMGMRSTGSSGGADFNSLLVPMMLSRGSMGSTSENPMLFWVAMQNPRLLPFILGGGEMNPMNVFMLSSLMSGSGMRT